VLGGWALAYGAVKCEAGHTYIGRLHKECPRCKPGGTGQQRSPFSLPFALGRR
jgi:hypothetical protein